MNLYFEDLNFNSSSSGTVKTRNGDRVKNRNGDRVKNRNGGLVVYLSQLVTTMGAKCCLLCHAPYAGYHPYSTGKCVVNKNFISFIIMINTTIL